MPFEEDQPAFVQILLANLAQVAPRFNIEPICSFFIVTGACFPAAAYCG
jgi:hypothetical protein